MNEVLTLIKRTPDIDANGDPVTIETRREVFARVGSIGMREFYAASTTDFHPEAKFILADYLDYNEETLVIYNGHPFRVLRTYRNGQELELTVESAPVDDFEEAEVDG
jgi:SPP1 family predicted phage head-tail adaptor